MTPYIMAAHFLALEIGGWSSHSTVRRGAAMVQG